MLKVHHWGWQTPSRKNHSLGFYPMKIIKNQCQDNHITLFKWLYLVTLFQRMGVRAAQYIKNVSSSQYQRSQYTFHRELLYQQKVIFSVPSLHDLCYYLANSMIYYTYQCCSQTTIRVLCLALLSYWLVSMEWSRLNICQLLMYLRVFNLPAVCVK